MSEDPKRIYLQPGPDDPDPEFGRTWCTEPIFKPGDREEDCPGDTEYVRADLYTALQAELAAAREHIARYQWQPISTAPKDETDVLTCNKNGYMMTDWFLEGARDPWVSDPTHWMPLPPPPTNA